MLKHRTFISTVLTLLLLSISIYGQQSNRAIYLYDDNGRLSAIISPNGEAIVYEMAISRLSVNDLHI
jgi:hypothetical protein